MSVIENSRPAFSPDPTDCPWVSEDGLLVKIASETVTRSILSLSFTHLIGSNCLYELKEDLSPVMLKEIFRDSFENFEITRICIENHASVTGWQKLFSHKCVQLSAAVAITTFEIYGGEFSGYLILICSFSLY